MRHRNLLLPLLAGGLVLAGCRTPAAPGGTDPAAGAGAGAATPGARRTAAPRLPATRPGAAAPAPAAPGPYDVAGEGGASAVADDRDPDEDAAAPALRATPRPTATATATRTPAPTRTQAPTWTPAPAATATPGSTLTPPPLPTPTPAPAGGQANGAGVVLAAPTNSVSFTFRVQEGLPHGDFDVYGSIDDVAFRFMGAATSVAVSAGQVTVSGTGSFNGAAASFTAQGQDGATDALSLAIASGGATYAITGNLSRGSITVTP